MTTERSGSILTIVSAVLWLLMVGLAASDHWFAALFVLLGLLWVYGLLGSMHKGRIDWRLMLFPVLPWLVMWAIAFAGANHFAEVFANRPPDFTVLGFHPSFAVIIVLFWVVPTLLMSFGFEAVKDRWLSERRWQEYVRQVGEMGEPDETERRP
jgi:hypothetical protein